MRLLVTTFTLDANLAVLPYEAFPVSAMNLSVVLSPPLPGSSSTFLCSYSSFSHICCPPFNLLYFSPPVSHTRLQPSPHLFLTILLRTLPPRSCFFFFLSSLSLLPAALCFTDQISGCGNNGSVACAANSLCASIRGCLYNPHKSPHPPFGLLGKHNGCLSSIQQQIQRR